MEKILVHAAVFLFGMAGLFAKWIQLPALAITFGRVLFSSVTLGIFMAATGQPFRIGNRRDALLLAAAGMILAVHWCSFLGSIQLSTVAVGTITFSSFPLFVTFLEPLVFHKKLSAGNVLCAIVILAGVAITVPEFSAENRMFLGILTGMVSALSYAVLTVMNKILSNRYSATATAFFEQSVAAVVLFPFVLGLKTVPSRTDIGLLILLGVFMTALAHTLFISSLKKIPAQFAGVCSSMETVYGILLAFLLLGETPSVREWIGAVVIVGTVIFAQLRSTGETG